MTEMMKMTGKNGTTSMNGTTNEMTREYLDDWVDPDDWND